MADGLFAEPRLAAIYDVFDSDRSDLAAYAAMADEFGARSVLDIGCGTGTLGCLLASRGLSVTGLDPAAASLDVARAKPGAAKVRWVHGTVSQLPALRVDLVTMTGNVAQVFLTDAEWAAVLRAAFTTLRPGGRLVFETRVPERQAWRDWDRTVERADIPEVGVVEIRAELTAVRGEFVSFRRTYRFESDGAVLVSDSTLRFRSRAAVADSLAAAGFTLDDVRDAPDRPGLELVFVARRDEQAPDG
jgi:SAM-dependent methyltransferase